MLGKFAPVRTAPRSLTLMSVQLRPLGSLTFGIAGPKATGKQRPIQIWLSAPLSWMTKTCFTGAGRMAKVLAVMGWPSVVATGLTSLLPIIASLQVARPLTGLRGPNSIPADALVPLTGGGYITRTLPTMVAPGQFGIPGPISSFAR